MLKNLKISPGLFRILLRWVQYPAVFQAVTYLLKKLLRWRRGYRSSTIESNLAGCPALQLSHNQVSDIKHKYYAVLERYVMEIISLATQKKVHAADWVEMDCLAEWQTWFSQQRSTIITASHYGNWEITIPLLPQLLKIDVVGFYKPLKDKNMDEWVRTIRGNFGLVLQPIEQTARIMAARRHLNTAYVFIGDQSPVNLNGTYWNTFLGRSTPWLTGAEKLARKFDYPVVYLQQIPVDMELSVLRRRLAEKSTRHPLYHITIHPIADEPAKLPDGLLTEQYARLLESEILREPKWWLWSHRRWKRADFTQREEPEAGRLSGLH